MWSFSQDLTAILVKQEPSLLLDPAPAASPVVSAVPPPLTLAPPPQRNAPEDKVGPCQGF